MSTTGVGSVDVVPRRTVEDENEALIRRFYAEIFNQGNLGVADQIVAPDFVDHIPTPLPGQPMSGPEAVTWTASMFRTAFPDLDGSIEDVIAKGDKVVTRVTWSGTQQGPLMGADATHKSMRVMGIDISRVSGGKLVEHWGELDVLDVVAQLGFLPDVNI